MNQVGRASEFAEQFCWANKYFKAKIEFILISLLGPSKTFRENKASAFFAKFSFSSSLRDEA